MLVMREVKMKAVVIVVAALLLASTCSGAVLAKANLLGAAETSPSLQSVTSRTLAASGLTLSPASGAPTISADDAAKVALTYYSGSQVRERVLAVVHDTHIQPNLDRLCWVVSITPPGGIWSYDHRIAGTYQLLMIDAATGKYIFGTKGGEVR
jgi:hypothetical protein